MFSQSIDNYQSHNVKCADVYYKAHKFIINCSACEFCTSLFESFQNHFRYHLKPKQDGIVEQSNMKLEHENDDLEILRLGEVKATASEKISYVVDKPNGDKLADEAGQFITIYDEVKNDMTEFERLEIEVLEERLQRIDGKEGNVKIEHNCTTTLLATIASPKHLRESRFACRYCNKRFGLKANCKMHEQRHTNVRPYACDQCTKAFFTQVELRNHQRLHTDERSYMCEECGKSFRHSWVLQKHQRTHATHEAILPCPECGKLFAFKDNLRNHLEIHNTEEKFVCEVCKASFTQSKNLWRHRKKHEAPLSCSQ